MNDRPVMTLAGRTANQAGLDRLLEILVTLVLHDTADGIDQAELLTAQMCGLSMLRVLDADEGDHAPAGAPRVVIEADNGVRFAAWPPERLTDPDVQAALHLVSRFVPRLVRRPQPIVSGDDPDPGGAGGIVGRSDAIRRLHERIARVASRSFSVLIEGESGVGKELVARRVHALSARRRGPFVAVNCAAIVESLIEAELFGIEERTATGVRGRRGKFETADGGTLFLDEVADLSSAAQAKLLRAIQDLAVERVGGHGMRQLDVRIIAATNRPLSSAIAAGTFRRDLYYRLNAVEITVPPLRARREDIPLLAERFLARYGEGRKYRLTTRARDALIVHEWPGNVRELERVIERAVTLAASEAIDIGDLPESVVGRYHEVLGPSPYDQDNSLRAWASRYARLVLAQTHGNKREACRVLDISYHTLQSHLSYGTRPGTSCDAGQGTGGDAPARDGRADTPGLATEGERSEGYPDAVVSGSAMVHEGPAASRGRTPGSDAASGR